LSQYTEQVVHSKQQQCAPTGPGLIRDDRAGTLTAALDREIAAAHRLVEHAELLADDEAFACWREQFSTWRERCGETLQTGFEREAAEEFYGGTLIRVARGKRWRAGQRDAQKAVEDMTQLLVTLRASLVGRGRAGNAIRFSGPPLVGDVRDEGCQPRP
jgi:hypothetical protein